MVSASFARVCMETRPKLALACAIEFPKQIGVGMVIFPKIFKVSTKMLDGGFPFITDSKLTTGDRNIFTRNIFNAKISGSTVFIKLNSNNQFERNKIYKHLVLPQVRGGSRMLCKYNP